MNQTDLISLVKSMELKPLTAENFDGFVETARGLFLPGIKFQEYFSPGENDSSKTKYDFTAGKPDYIPGEILTFENLEVRAIAAESKRWVVANFENNFCEVWGYGPNRRPLLFGFDPGRAFYIAEQEHNGTVTLPWETVYLRL